jgi:lysosomal acid lipase/cholesteryl ester hydrolase
MPSEFRKMKSDPQHCKASLYQEFLPIGYTYDTYTVTTDDGYILNMFRLHKKFHKLANIGKPVIFLQHGLGMSGDAYIIHHEKEALGFMLVEAGFDVWIGNARGTKYSYTHKTYDHNSEEFWQFSWQQMAVHDIPTCLNYV